MLVPQVAWTSHNTYLPERGAVLRSRAAQFFLGIYFIKVIHTHARTHAREHKNILSHFLFPPINFLYNFLFLCENIFFFIGPLAA